VSTYLEALNPCITDKFVPSPYVPLYSCIYVANDRMIIQSLLYFTLHPPEISPTTPTPLSILYKIASLHSTSSLMNHNTIPVYPREKIDIPNWINYEVNGDIAKNVKKRMRGCEREGIWDLIWESSIKSKDREERKGRKRRRRARDEESDEDEEEEGAKVKKVSENGWVILEWLVHIWEKEQEERGGESLSHVLISPSLSLFNLRLHRRSSLPFRFWLHEGVEVMANLRLLPRFPSPTPKIRGYANRQPNLTSTSPIFRTQPN
jgi:hypothetical protein